MANWGIPKMNKEFNNVQIKKQIEELSNELPSFSSPTSSVSDEETRILTEFINQKNLFNITTHDENLRKPLVLKQFFKMKRNQQVVINSVIKNEEVFTTEGKVATIGRDFVMLTDLKKRIWIPFSAIISATIPFGFPTYSNTHQHFIYDNQLQQKLVLQFGETVANKDALIRQFFEESLQTNLHSWRAVFLEVKTSDFNYVGKIIEINEKELFLQLFKTTQRIPLNEIRYASTLGLFNSWKVCGILILKSLMKSKF